MTARRCRWEVLAIGLGVVLCSCGGAAERPHAPTTAADEAPALRTATDPNVMAPATAESASPREDAWWRPAHADAATAATPPTHAAHLEAGPVTDPGGRPQPQLPVVHGWYVDQPPPVVRPSDARPRFAPDGTLRGVVGIPYNPCKTKACPSAASAKDDLTQSIPHPRGTP